MGYMLKQKKKTVFYDVACLFFVVVFPSGVGARPWGLFA